MNQQTEEALQTLIAAAVLCEGCAEVYVIDRKRCLACEQIDMDLESRWRAHDSLRTAAERSHRAAVEAGTDGVPPWFDFRDAAEARAERLRDHLHPWLEGLPGWAALGAIAALYAAVLGLGYGAFRGFCFFCEWMAAR